MFQVSRSQLFTILIFFVALTVFTYINRYPTGDDGWLGEQSFWLEKTGIIRSEFFRGLLKCEDQILVSHKLFILFGAAMIRIFGYQLPVLQFVGLIFFLVVIFEVIFYVRKSGENLNSWFLLATLILLFSNRLLVKMSFENRPEMMVAAFGFGSFLCLLNDKITTPKAILAGFLAGLALLCHLNGVIYLVAGLATLLYLRKYFQAFCFSAVSGLTSLLYFLDVLIRDNGFSFWYYQFAGDPLTQEHLKWSSKLIQMLTYPRLFLHSPEQAALSILLLFLIWSQRRFLGKLPVKIQVYSLSMFFAFWIITKANASTYMVLFIPFMLVLVYELYKLRPFDNLGFRLVLATYFIIGVFGMFQIIHRNFTMEYLPVSYERLRPAIDDDKTGFVPLTFLFDEYEAYPRLLTHENYELQLRKKNMTTKTMANWAYRNGAGFILMDYKFHPEPYYPKAGTKMIPFYKLKFFNGRFAIYER